MNPPKDLVLEQMESLRDLLLAQASHTDRMLGAIVATLIGLRQSRADALVRVFAEQGRTHLHAAIARLNITQN
jgi:hypothetical protein